MDFLIILVAFLVVVYFATEYERKLMGRGKKGSSCPPHPWRPRKSTELGSHYLICDQCKMEPNVVTRDTPGKK